jgi:hypothetical protein
MRQRMLLRYSTSSASSLPAQHSTCELALSTLRVIPTHTHTHTHTHKQGGLDNYIVNTREDKLDSELGLQLKEQVFCVRTQLPFAFRVVLAVCLGFSAAVR